MHELCYIIHGQDITVHVNYITGNMHHIKVYMHCITMITVHMHYITENTLNISNTILLKLDSVKSSEITVFSR